MLNLMFKENGNLIVTGFKYLYNAKFIAIREVAEMLRISKEEVIKDPNFYYTFNGFFDPNFKIYILDYFDRRKIKGNQFVELDETYFEMITKHAPPIEKAIQEYKFHALDDPDNFKIYFL